MSKSQHLTPDEEPEYRLADAWTDVYEQQHCPVEPDPYRFEAMHDADRTDRNRRKHERGVST